MNSKLKAFEYVRAYRKNFSLVTLPNPLFPKSTFSEQFLCVSPPD